MPLGPRSRRAENRARAEVGCALIRAPQAHLRTFTLTPEYLETTSRGVASGRWLFDLGLQTSRGFRALKVWMAPRERGADKIGRIIDQSIDQAHWRSRLPVGAASEVMAGSSQIAREPRRLNALL